MLGLGIMLKTLTEINMNVKKLISYFTFSSLSFFPSDLPTVGISFPQRNDNTINIFVSEIKIKYISGLFYYVL